MAGRGPDEGAAKAVLDQRGVSLPCPDPEDGPGVEDATSGAPEGGVPARHAAPQGADYEVAPFGAPLPHSREGQGKGRRQPRASRTKGPMNHACMHPSPAARVDVPPPRFYRNASPSRVKPE